MFLLLFAPFHFSVLNTPNHLSNQFLFIRFPIHYPNSALTTQPSVVRQAREALLGKKMILGQMNDFFLSRYSYMSSWNQLLLSVRHAPSLQPFKSSIKTSSVHPSAIFLTFSPTFYVSPTPPPARIMCLWLCVHACVCVYAYTHKICVCELICMHGGDICIIEHFGCSCNFGESISIM